MDDEPLVLQGIRRSLRSMHVEWEIELATSGAEALVLMDKSPFDVVISDMRMPGMDGAELLERVRSKFPDTVRMVLSGQSDRETVLRSVGPTHQYISKPCDSDELKRKLTRAFALREILTSAKLKEIVSHMETVPSLPSLYVAITKALQTPDISVSKIGDIIAQDIGMSSKVLQLVNSAFFGLPCRVSNPRQAVTFIGIDNIRALVLSVHVFTGLEDKLTPQLASLWSHSLAVAGFATAIAQLQGNNQSVADEAFAAGLLHDVGKLVLVSACKAQYTDLLKKGHDHPTTILEMEQETFGCTHAEIGAYLLGLWGLPDPVVEAVAWHHTPARAALAAFSPLIAVHVAEHAHHQFNPSLPGGYQAPLDEELLVALGLKEQIGPWMKACKELDSASSSKRGDTVSPSSVPAGTTSQPRAVQKN